MALIPLSKHVGAHSQVPGLQDTDLRRAGGDAEGSRGSAVPWAGGTMTRKHQKHGDRAGEAGSTWFRKGKSCARMLFAHSFTPCLWEINPSTMFCKSSVGTGRFPAPISNAYANACHPAGRGTNSAPGTGLRAHRGHSQLTWKANFHGSQPIGRSNKTKVTFTPLVLTTAYWKHISWLRSISN